MRVGSTIQKKGR